MIRWTSLLKHLLMFDFIYVLPRCNNFENNWDKSISSVKICCWFKYAVISVITTRDLSRSTIHNVRPAKRLRKYTGNTLWRSTNLMLENCSHAGCRGSRTLGMKWAQNEITKRKLSVPGRRAYPTSRSSPFLIAPFAFSHRTTSQDRRIKARAQKKTI